MTELLQGGPAVPTRRPVIVIPARFSVGATALRSRAEVAARALVEAVWAAGGEPLIVHPSAPGGSVSVDEVRDRLWMADGVLLPGGGDLAARWSGQDHHETLYDVDEEQDAFDLALASVALADELPLLAVCRGNQVVNVLLGGDLVQDMGETVGDHRHRVHEIEVVDAWPAGGAGRPVPGVLLPPPVPGPARRRAWCPPPWPRTASSRRSCCPNAQAWYLGVQWHPEDLAATDPVAGRHLPAFVDACALALRPPSPRTAGLVRRIVSSPHSPPPRRQWAFHHAERRPGMTGCGCTTSRCRSTATSPDRTRGSTTRSASGGWRCTTGSSRPRPGAAMIGESGGTAGARRRVPPAGHRGHRRHDHGPQHVRPGPRRVARRLLAGLVGRRAAVPPRRLRAHPSRSAHRWRWPAAPPSTSSPTGSSSALEQATEAAAGQDIRLGGGASTVRQFLRAGLVDELHLAIVPILLGSGERLFDDLPALSETLRGRRGRPLAGGRPRPPRPTGMRDPRG